MRFVLILTLVLSFTRSAATTPGRSELAEDVTRIVLEFPPATR